MFYLRAAVLTVKTDPTNCSFPKLSGGFLVGYGLQVGATAAYNAIGYALLSGNALMTSQLTMGQVVQSGMIGTAIMVPINVGMYIFCTEEDDDDAFWNMLACGSCGDVLEAVIDSLIGAQIQGLFVNNVTTPAYIAAGAATGTAAFIAGVTAAIIVVGGTAYFCGELRAREIVLIPTNCFPNFSAKDLVRPCEVGLNICSREQMLAFITSCAQCCPKLPAAAPKSAEMTRQEPEIVTATQAVPIDVNNIPYAEEINLTNIPVANLEQNSMASASVPSAPPEDEVKNKLTMG